MGQIPIHCLPEPFINPMGRSKTEHLGGLGNIGLRMPHIALAKVHVLRLMVLKVGKFFEKESPDHFVELIKAGTFINCHIIDLIDGLRILRQCRQKICLDDVSM